MDGATSVSWEAFCPEVLLLVQRASKKPSLLGHKLELCGLLVLGLKCKRKVNELIRAVISAEIGSREDLSPANWELSWPSAPPKRKRGFNNTGSFPLDVSTNSDIEIYATIRENGLPPGQICPPGGTSAAILNMKPNACTPMHRTTTLGYGIVLEGLIELLLDGGEKVILKAGDTCVMRSGMHQWKNVVPNDGWTKMFLVAQAIQVPVIGGKMLGDVANNDAQ
ncbi:MAG: hypothetical protein M1820_006779 [Bogoriella megaspora]|nr:MAG: hypothetical protein M1820_006779 [Bogoriella megaspora]